MEVLRNAFGTIPVRGICWTIWTNSNFCVREYTLLLH